MKNKTKNIKIFQVLNDQIFWDKFSRACPNPSLVRLMNVNRKHFKVPWKNAFKKFIEEYKFITQDKRDNREIIIDLLSEV